MRRSMLQADTDHKTTIYSIRLHQKVPFFIKETAENGRFFGQRFLTSATQLKNPSLL